MGKVGKVKKQYPRWAVKLPVVQSEYFHLTAVHDLTRSTQRAQTSLAEADHYSHIAHCKNVQPWL